MPVSTKRIRKLDVTSKKDADRLVAEARRIVERNPGIEFENVWHTLLVLRESPLERLRGSLLRGRAAPLW